MEKLTGFTAEGIPTGDENDSKLVDSRDIKIEEIADKINEIIDWINDHKDQLLN
jgi:hypothetical protein